MKDIEQLLKMTERPQDYSDEEVRQLMSDPEMREYYELMVSAEEGFAERFSRNEECGMRNEECSAVENSLQGNLISHSLFYRIAALFIGVLLLSGIAYAAYHVIRSQETGDRDLETVAVANSQLSTLNSPLEQQPQAATIHTFEDAELQEILQALSAHYHVGVEYRSEASRHVRLYTKWDTTAPLQQIIELLNEFDKVSVRLSDNQIIAE